ncbi:hypothetical protein WJX84_007917 [Apatococcus fuscideae]|uniref:Uncharacterized protein n=1 Tax=Apatococcus fuscideae TaxID=2026836 RepID=A0AAW1T2I7_9CHLO
MSAGLQCTSKRVLLTGQRPRSQRPITQITASQQSRSLSSQATSLPKKQPTPIWRQPLIPASQTSTRRQHFACRGAPEQPGYRQSEGASGGGSGGSGGGGFGGDGRGGGDSNDDDSSSSKPTFGWKGWRDRVAADQQFPYKVFIEQVIGVGAAVIGDMSSRPYWGIYELDFVFSTLVVGSIVNFSLMYFLAPTAGPQVHLLVSSRPSSATASCGPGALQRATCSSQALQ